MERGILGHQRRWASLSLPTMLLMVVAPIALMRWTTNSTMNITRSNMGDILAGSACNRICGFRWELPCHSWRDCHTRLKMDNLIGCCSSGNILSGEEPSWFARWQELRNAVLVIGSTLAACDYDDQQLRIAALSLPLLSYYSCCRFLIYSSEYISYLFCTLSWRFSPEST